MGKARLSEGKCSAFQIVAKRCSKSADGDKEGEYSEFVFPVEPSLADLTSIHIGILGFPALTSFMAIKLPFGDPLGSFFERSYF